MKKSLIKSLLPVLVVVLVLSVATISVMADVYKYCPEKEGCTYTPAAGYDGLGVDGDALEAAAAAATYDGLGVDGEALEAAAAAAAYDGLGVDGDALEAGAAAEYWDGFHTFVKANCDDVADDIDGLA